MYNMTINFLRMRCDMAIKNEIIMKIDNIGRLVIPKKYREALDICNDKTVLLKLDGDKIILKKNKKEQYLDFIIENFIKNWANIFADDTIIITDLNSIIEVYGKNKFSSCSIDKKIIEMINRDNFKWTSLKNEKLFENNNLYFFDIISLEIDNSKLGSIIFVHENEENLNNKFNLFIFELFKNFNK